jgi:exodeoxyribonuclease V alpha subunit
MSERVQGSVERITYANEENGYCVIKIKVPGRKDLVSAVGAFVSVTPGEVLRMEGSWGFHARYGDQFTVDRYETVTPSTSEGIQKYLGSGLIKGIGPVMAERIVKRFGEKTLEVIDKEAERLKEIDGIGPYRVERIQKAWNDQKEIRGLMIFLRSHSVNSTYAARIFKHYGKESLTVLQENPYRLAMDITGIGFISADKIARNLGFAVDSPLRAEAGILYVLHQMTEEGHVCAPFGLLIEKSEALLEIPASVLEGAMERLNSEKRIILENIPDAVRTTFGADRAVYLAGYHTVEVQAAKRLLYLQAFKRLHRKVDPDKAVEWLKSKFPIKLAPLQEQAVKQALTGKVIIITGGPGTGKTTLIRAILIIYREMGARVCLAAPTGRAAKRLSEATRHTASTIHRLLEFSPQLGGFQRNEQKPLSADLVIVDEASMLDNLLMHHLLKAIPSHAVLVLVGDVDQLPSVGPGNVLKDIITSDKFPVVRLTEIFRQARESHIVMNAHLVRQGKFPKLQPASEELQDFYFIEKEDPEEVIRIMVKLCTERIPARFGLDPVDDVQVLSPMQRGAIGARRLNSVLQEALNPQKQSVERAGRVFRLHDKVMQIRNNYDKDVFNGDLGRISSIDMESQEVQVEIDGRPVPYDLSELDELVHAYAVSVHKSQGSEYPAVIVPLLTQHYVMLQRNLLYTAITRGKKLVIVVGSKKALAMAIRNDKMLKRFTLLKERLSGALET